MPIYVAGQNSLAIYASEYKQNDNKKQVESVKCHLLSFNYPLSGRSEFHNSVVYTIIKFETTNPFNEMFQVLNLCRLKIQESKRLLKIASLQ